MEKQNLNLYLTSVIVDINEILNSHNAFVTIEKINEKEKFIIIYLKLLGESCSSCSSLNSTKEQIKKLIIEDIKDTLQYKGRINVHFINDFEQDKRMVLKD